jgi:hypothetical protein
MNRTEADWRELAKAVERVHRVDAGIDRAVRELRRSSQRHLVTTCAALGLGVAAIATLTATVRKASDRRHPVKVPPQRSIVDGLVATLTPWAFSAALRHRPSRPARPSAESARDRSETDQRNHLKPVNEGDPQ